MQEQPFLHKELSYQLSVSWLLSNTCQCECRCLSLFEAWASLAAKLGSTDLWFTHMLWNQLGQCPCSPSVVSATSCVNALCWQRTSQVAMQGLAGRTAETPATGVPRSHLRQTAASAP